MKKFVTILLVVIMMATMFAGCGVTNKEAQAEPEVEKTNNGVNVEYWGSIGGYCTHAFQDPVTGVWYITVSNGGTTPRLNADGSLYTGN